jgi:hypothetical protein
VLAADSDRDDGIGVLSIALIAAGAAALGAALVLVAGRVLRGRDVA